MAGLALAFTGIGLFVATVGFAKGHLTLPVSPLGGWLLAVVAGAGFIAVMRFSRR